jgi:hypothetical protein
MTEELQQNLKAIILEHLSRLEQYKPAHGRAPDRLTATELKQALASDPVYSIFGLDSPEYIAATLAGGTITSIHRKIGDAYEDCIDIEEHIESLDQFLHPGARLAYV